MNFPAPRLIKQRQIDDIAHAQIAGVAGVQMVAAIIFGQHTCQVGRVGQRGLEVDDRVERVGGPDPAIDFLPDRFAFGRI